MNCTRSLWSSHIQFWCALTVNRWVIMFLRCISVSTQKKLIFPTCSLEKRRAGRIWDACQVLLQTICGDFPEAAVSWWVTQTHTPHMATCMCDPTAVFLYCLYFIWFLYLFCFYISEKRDLISTFSFCIRCLFKKNIYIFHSLHFITVCGCCLPLP